jgi:tape measure domain-containing protein
MATERYIIEISTRGVARSQKQLQALGITAQRTTKFLGFLRAALVVFASIAILSAFAQYADALTRMSNKMRLVTSNTKQLNSVMGELFNISQRTRTSFEANVDLFTKVARSTSTMKLTFGELLEVTEAVAIATKISGEEASTAANGLRQFGQALASGTLNGDELRSVTENLARLASALATEFGVTGAQLRKFGKDNPGMLTNIRLVKALIEQFPQLREELGLTELTIQDAFVRFNNQLQVFIGNLSASLGLAQKVDDVLQFIAVHLVQITIAIAALGALTAFNFIVTQILLLEVRLLALASIVFRVFTGMIKLLGLVLLPWKALRLAVLGVGAAANTLLFIIPLMKGMAAAVLGTVRAVGFLIVAFRTGTFWAKTWAGAVALATVAMKALRLAILRNPLFLLGAAIVSAAAVAFFVFKSAIDSTVESLGGLKGITNIVLAAIAALVPTFKAIVDNWDAIWEELKVIVANAFIDMDNALKQWAADFNNRAGEIGDILVAAIVVGLSAIPAALNSIMNEVILAVLDGVNSLIERMNKIIKENPITADFLGLPSEGFQLIDTKSLEEADSLIESLRKTYDFVLESKPISGLIGESTPEFTQNIVSEHKGAVAEILDVYSKAYQEILAQDPTGVLADKFSEVFDFLSGALGFKIDPKDLFELPEIQGQGELTKQIENLSKSMASLLSSISPFAAGMLKMKAAQDLVAEASMKGIDLFDRYGVSADEVIRRVQRDLVGAGNAATDYTEKVKLLDSAVGTGAVSQAEANRLLREYKIELLETQTGALAGMELGLLKVAETANDAGSQIADAIVGAFDQATEAFLDFVRTGKFSFSSLVDFILIELTRIAFQKSVVASLTSLIGSVIPGASSITTGGNLSTDIAKGVSPESGLGTTFAHGGAFTVGQSSSVGTVSGAGVDNRLIAFRARDGERVEVTPPGETADKQRKATLNLTQNFNITNAIDPDGFARSQPQMAARGLNAAERFRNRIS